jgi:carboxymethylenebutenolidase
MADTLAEVRRHPLSNGRAVAMGFCYGGPYAILGPARLGFDAGIGCHSTQMKDFIGALEGVARPVCLLWGDQDHVAPAEVLDAYCAVPSRMKNVEVHVFPGILHGYMMPAAGKAFDAKSREFSMGRARALLEGMRG